MFYFLSLFYKFINYIHRSCTKKKKLNSLVVSIGNITTGGTGKTPITIYLAKELQKMNFDVAILSRGYKGSLSKKGALLTNGKDIYLEEKESGDEPFLMAKKLKDIPIAIGRNRYQMGNKILLKHCVHIFLLDDAFQHYKLYREIDILLIDATNPFGGEYLLPKGRLREPLSSLGRAKIIIITKTNLVSKDIVQNIQNKIMLYTKAIIMPSEYIPIQFININNQKDNLPMNKINRWESKNIYLISSIGSPSSFKKILSNLPIKKHFIFKDHHRFQKKDINLLLSSISRDDIIITTEKDWIRLEHFKHLFLEYKNFYILKMAIQLAQKDREELLNLIASFVQKV